MAILPIYEVPHPVLSEMSTRVEQVDDSIRKLLDDMAETMFAAPGIGLASVQVGDLRAAHQATGCGPERRARELPQRGEQTALDI